MDRVAGLDRVKASATAAVVAIHSLGLFFRADTVGVLTPLLTEWAVPAFFFVAGYVRARTEPFPAGQMRRWLLRLLPLYLLASVLALLTRSLVLGEAVSLSEAVTALAIGDAWGIYYFVPMLIGALAFALLLARFPRLVPWVWAISLAALIYTRIHEWNDPLGRHFGLRGIVRSPLFWWGYFVSGWFVKLYVECIPRRVLFAASAGLALLATTAMYWEYANELRGVHRVINALGITMAILYWSDRPASSLTTKLSSYSYEIYLFHFFFIAVAVHYGFMTLALHRSFLIWVLAILTGSLLGFVANRAVSLLPPMSRK